jgi:hypothetical protein
MSPFLYFFIEPDEEDHWCLMHLIVIFNGYLHQKITILQFLLLNSFLI